MEGRFDELDEFGIESNVLEYKNSLMIPLYANVKSLVKKLKTSEIDRLYEEMELVIGELERTIVRSLGRLRRTEDKNRHRPKCLLAAHQENAVRLGAAEKFDR